MLHTRRIKSLRKEVDGGTNKRIYLPYSLQGTKWKVTLHLMYLCMYCKLQTKYHSSLPRRASVTLVCWLTTFRRSLQTSSLTEYHHPTARRRTVSDSQQRAQKPRQGGPNSAGGICYIAFDARCKLLTYTGNATPLLEADAGPSIAA